MKSRKLHQLYMLMIFGNGTHSKGDPDPAHLTFHTKVQVWGRMVKVPSSIHTKDRPAKRERGDVSYILV
jgi:hypothetical protein